MALSKKDFNTLLEMQKLCTQVENDLEKVTAFRQFMEEAEKRRKALADSYEKDWLRLIESDDVDDDQYKAVEALVPEGRYSIFAEDTIWNVLSDLHIEYKEILKMLVNQL
ncbi:MAG: DUF4298 domain-containing protein [Anaerolineaceae bacterium]|nr:DUF4298 domain-containing protein [Anaerolineaceae bacterium]